MEQWRDIPGYDGFYQASTLGRIRRFAKMNRDGRVVPTRVLSPGRTGRYLNVNLSVSNVQMPRDVHTLVALTFLGPRLDGMEVNHKDGDHYNPQLDNLEYVTPKENMRHAYHVTQVYPRGERHYNAKLKTGDIERMRALRKRGMMVKDIAVKFGIGPKYASEIMCGRTWSEMRSA